MMSFFTTPVCAPASADPSFTSLFRLLDDFESYQQQSQQGPRNAHNNGTQQRARRASPRAPTPFTPKFDVRETETTYELHGELPGLERENVQIEFTEPQTIVVRGRVERTYQRKPEAEAEVEQQEQQTKPTAEEKQQRRNSHQATVEDDPEEPSTPTHTPPESPAPQAAKPVVRQDKQQQVQKTPGEKYWAVERSIGEFSRTFTFPSRVEHEGVSASLDNGILTVSVPKAKKHQVRRIQIV